MVDVIKHEMRATSAGLPCRGDWSKKRIVISFVQAIRRLLFVVSLCCATAAGSVAFGQDEDVIDDTIAPVPARAAAAPERTCKSRSCRRRRSSIPSRLISGFSTEWGCARGEEPAGCEPGAAD